MRKFLIILTVFGVLFFMLNGSWAFNKPRNLGKVIKVPKIPILKLVKLEIETNSSGKWLWVATVKNMGPASANGRDLIVQGYSKDFATNTWKPASGSIVSRDIIKAGQTVVVKCYWTRCCKTHELKVVLRRRGSNNVLDSKKLIGLACIPQLPFDVRIRRIEWDNSNKRWRAKVRNGSKFVLKIGIQGYIHKGGANSQGIPAGGQVMNLRPNSEALTMWHYAPSSTKNGDLLKVHMWFSSGCSEDSDVRKCGFEGSNIITIPHSRTFF